MKLEAVADLSPALADGTLVAFGVGPHGDAHAVVALRELDYRRSNAAGASFAKVRPDGTQDYRVVAWSSAGELTLDVRIDGERFNVHLVQPLGDELLLACARSQRRGDGDFDRNGRVYARGGEFLREMLLGDGIQGMQASVRGEIWTGYFDEGVFGNFGWDEPVGASGLVAWDKNGAKTFEFSPGAAAESIDDCYALNVEGGDSVWLYYYSPFDLVRLQGGRVEFKKKMPVSGSKAFAVSGRHALFYGNYQERDVCQLVCLDGAPKCVASFALTGADGEKIGAAAVEGRGGALHILGGDGLLYRAGVETAVSLASSGR